jgi:hypothetical protein
MSDHNQCTGCKYFGKETYPLNTCVGVTVYHTCSHPNVGPNPLRLGISVTGDPDPEQCDSYEEDDWYKVNTCPHCGTILPK